MHSENLGDQELCVQLYKELEAECESNGVEGALLNFVKGSVKYAAAHRDVIAEWGRFPHRNAILNRESTPEEQQGLLDGSIKGF